MNHAPLPNKKNKKKKKHPDAMKIDPNPTTTTPT